MLAKNPRPMRNPRTRRHFTHDEIGDGIELRCTLSHEESMVFLRSVVCDGKLRVYDFVESVGSQFEIRVALPYSLDDGLKVSFSIESDASVVGS